jgi:hypothetical protein
MGAEMQCPPRGRKPAASPALWQDSADRERANRSGEGLAFEERGALQNVAPVLAGITRSDDEIALHDGGICTGLGRGRLPRHHQSRTYPLGFALPANEELDIYQHVHKSGILVASLWLSSIALAGPLASISGPVDKQGALAHRQLWRVPSTDPDVLMFATVFRPSGSGPLPLVVMNHGTTQNPVQRQYFPLLEFEAAALLFVRQGFVVAAPQHPG